jgi:hypothetical protein
MKPDQSYAAEISRSIRPLLFFFTYMTAALLAIDAIFFGGQYRKEAWRGLTYQGQVFNLDVERLLRKSLW